MQDNMSREDVEKVEAFIQNEELCDFCTLSGECPKGMRCYGGEPIASLHGFKRSFCRDVHR